jgi:hypothetical protein
VLRSNDSPGTQGDVQKIRTETSSQEANFKPFGPCANSKQLRDAGGENAGGSSGRTILAGSSDRKKACAPNYGVSLEEAFPERTGRAALAAVMRFLRMEKN